MINAKKNWPNFFRQFFFTHIFLPKHFGQKKFWPKNISANSAKNNFGQKSGTGNLGPWIRNLGLRIWDSGSGTWDSGFGIEDLGLGIWDLDSSWPTDPVDQLGVAQLSQIFLVRITLLWEWVLWCLKRQEAFFCWEDPPQMRSKIVKSRTVKSIFPYKIIWNFFYSNTPGTAGGPGGRDRTLAVKRRKNAKNQCFFVKR